MRNLLNLSLLCFFLLLTLTVNVSRAQTYSPFRYGVLTGYQPKMAPATEQDVAAIRSQQQALDEAASEEIRYWNAAYPSYRWHQIMMAVSAAHEGHKNGGRVAIMHLAVRCPGCGVAVQATARSASPLRGKRGPGLPGAYPRLFLLHLRI